MPDQRLVGAALATIGLPLTVGGLGWLAKTARRRARLVPVTATVVRAYQASRYTGYADGEFTPHPAHHVEVVYNHPADHAGARVRRHRLLVYRRHRPMSTLRLLVDPTEPEARPVPYGLAGYSRPARVSALAGPVAAAGLGLLLLR